MPALGIRRRQCWLLTLTGRGKNCAAGSAAESARYLTQYYISYFTWPIPVFPCFGSSHALVLRCIMLWFFPCLLSCSRPKARCRHPRARIKYPHSSAKPRRRHTQAKVNARGTQNQLVKVSSVLRPMQVAMRTTMMNLKMMAMMVTTKKMVTLEMKSKSPITQPKPPRASKNPDYFAKKMTPWEKHPFIPIVPVPCKPIKPLGRNASLRPFRWPRLRPFRWLRRSQWTRVPGLHVPRDHPSATPPTFPRLLMPIPRRPMTTRKPLTRRDASHVPRIRNPARKRPSPRRRHPWAPWTRQCNVRTISWNTLIP